MSSRTFLIGECIFFRTSDAVIWSSVDEDEIMSIGLVQGRLLDYLLSHSGRTISRDELLGAVWTDHGLRPSGSSLNQNISILRRSLLQFGGSEDIIRTLPKIGYMIDENLVTEILQDTSAQTAQDLKSNNHKLSAQWMSLIIFSLFILGVLLWAGWKTMNNSKEFSDIQLYPLINVNGCEVYTMTKGSDVIDKIRRDLISKTIQAESCNNEVFYIFSINGYNFLHDGRGRFFLARCYRQKGVANSLLGCDTTYDRDYEKD